MTGRSRSSGRLRAIDRAVAAAALEELGGLRRRYLLDLPSRLDQIERAVDEWIAAPEDTLLRERARTLAHRLRGTAGSYGAAAVGACMGKIERALRQTSEGLAIEAEAQIAAVREGLASAREAAEEAIRRDAGKEEPS